MKKAIRNLVIWMTGIAVVPMWLLFIGEHYAAAWSFLSGILASVTMFGLFVPYVNSLIRRIPDEVWDYGHSSGEGLSALADSKEIHKLWCQRADEASLENLSDGELFPAYKKILLALLDINNPFFSEELVKAPPSEILQVGNRTRDFSFRRFCRKLDR